jgi:hypothetical protein
MPFNLPCVNVNLQCYLKIEESQHKSHKLGHFFLNKNCLSFGLKTYLRLRTFNETQPRNIARCLFSERQVNWFGNS